MDEIQNTSGENMEAAAPQIDTHEPQDNQQPAIPVHVVQSLRSENQQLKEKYKILVQHHELLKANQMQRPIDPLQSSMPQASDDEVVTIGDLKKYAQAFQRQQKMEVEELKIAHLYPDYLEIIDKYLPDVLKEDPDLRYEIENAKNPFKMAYRLAKNSSAYQQDNKKVKKSDDAERILANTGKSGSLSSVGTSTPIGQASRWKAMSDDEFRKVMNKNLSMGR